MPSYRRRRRREIPPLRLDLNGLLQATVGSAGVGADELSNLAPELDLLRAGLLADVAEGRVGFADLDRRRDEARTVQQLVSQLLGRYEALVVFGAGASAVGARLLGAARPLGRIRRPRLVVADSIDPVVMEELLGRLDLRRTLFNVVSKSGDAAETMAQFMVVRDRLLHELGAVDYRQHVVITTDAERGALRQIVNDEGFLDLAIPTDVQGADCLLTPTGLFPAAMTGVDVEELLDGAATMMERSLAASSALADPPVALAALLLLLDRHQPGRSLAMTPYSARLMPLAEWVSQLWSAHVGVVRHTDLVRHAGQGGFGQRVMTLLRLDEYPVKLETPAIYQDLEGVGFLGGHGFGEILNAEQETAEFLLARNGHPAFTVSLPTLSAGTLGQLVYLFQATAAVLARFDPTAQRAGLIGEAPRRTVGALLGRTGTEAEQADLAAWRARKDPLYVL